MKSLFHGYSTSKYNLLRLKITKHGSKFLHSFGQNFNFKRRDHRKISNERYIYESVDDGDLPFFISQNSKKSVANWLIKT